MPIISGNNAKIATNVPAENAYNALLSNETNVSQSQLKLSTGKRINNASDDVAGYITSRSLQARNGSLVAAQNSVGDAQNVTSIIQDALSNIETLTNTIKDSAASAASGSQGTDEKVALAKAAYRMAQQIQTVVDSTAFDGKQLIDGTYNSEYIIGSNSSNNLLTIDVNMTFNNPDFDIQSGSFNINSANNGNFGGVSGLNLESLNSVGSNNLGILSDSNIATTLVSLAAAIANIDKVASEVGGISNRLTSQNDLLQSQMTNYDAAISRLQDTDVAKEQLSLVKSQFLEQTSLSMLTQANQNPSAFLKLITG